MATLWGGIIVVLGLMSPISATSVAAVNPALAVGSSALFSLPGLTSLTGATLFLRGATVTPSPPLAGPAAVIAPTPVAPAATAPAPRP